MIIPALTQQGRIQDIHGGGGGRKMNFDKKNTVQVLEPKTFQFRNKKQKCNPDFLLFPDSFRVSGGSKGGGGAQQARPLKLDQLCF